MATLENPALQRDDVTERKALASNIEIADYLKLLVYADVNYWHIFLKKLKYLPKPL